MTFPHPRPYFIHIAPGLSTGKPHLSTTIYLAYWQFLLNEMQIALGFILGVLIALAARQMGSLSNSGAIAASLSGGIIFGFGGLPWALLLLAFFVSSSALSRAFSTGKHDLHEKFSKGSRRDWAQVMANGGLGTMLVLVQALQPGNTWPWIAYIGAMAAVNADTWATELGVLSRSLPHLITTGKPAEPGTSGAVSWMGIAASLAGAAFVGVFAAIFSPHGVSLPLLLVAALSGVSGSLLDSFLGATLQSIYFCPDCAKETERYPLHTCGAPTSPLRGLRWLDNDLVNFFASLFGALSALLLGWIVL